MRTLTEDLRALVIKSISLYPSVTIEFKQTMKRHLKLIVVALSISHAQSLLAFYRPSETKLSLQQLNVGLSHLPPPKYEKSPARQTSQPSPKLSAFESAWTKYSMISYIAHMCFAIPLALIPTFVKSKLQLAPKPEIEHEALQVGEACARNLLTLIPFMNLKVIPYVSENPAPTPTIWVSNHVSMLDTFVFLAADERLRGLNRRPIKVIYVSLVNIDTFDELHVVSLQCNLF